MADQILGTYSPEDLIIVLSNDNFTHTLSGYADGTFVNITRIVPHATLYSGSDNTNARVVRANKGSTVTLTLHQASESNDVLSQLLSLDEQTRDGTWTFSLMIKDGTGRSMYFCPQAFIGTNADSSFGSEIDTREWTLQCVSLTTTVGGNGKLTPDTYALLGDLGATVDTRWAPNT